ncbi:MAG: hypothetical protein ACPLRY_07740 [Candidatus Bathyarchaeales archaeon]
MPIRIEELKKLSAKRLTVEDRVEELCNNFESYLVEFDRANPFTGPSIYFHLKTLERLRTIGTLKALEDTLFFEYLYATLASWGMHRMGPQGAKLVEFTDFMKTLQSQKEKIVNLQGLKLTHLKEEELNDAINKLWNILSNLKVSSTETQLIACSKALHHILPNLMPPIDREHTLRFIYGYNPTYDSEEQRFKKTFPLFWKIGNREKSTILRWVGKGFHTSETKVIDNAIVGYVKTRMKKG